MRREELCTNNHTQAASAPLSWDLNCRPFRKRKAWVAVGEGWPVAVTGFHRFNAPSRLWPSEFT